MKWNSNALCPGQDIILYCKFIKETLQYRWCTIQGFIPSPAPLSAQTLNPRWLPAAGGGRQTVTITEFLVMVRVLWPSLHVIGAQRRIIVHLYLFMYLQMRFFK